MAAREVGPFGNLPDFCRRTRLPRRIIENLIVIGAMDRWGLPRRKLLWELGQLRYQAEELELVFPDDGLSWPPFSPTEAMALEYEVLGLLNGTIYPHGDGTGPDIVTWLQLESETILLYCK